MNNSNFRPFLMSLLLLVGVAAPVAAIAQAPISNIGSGSTDERLAQLERFSNAHSQLLTQLQQQLADSQRDIDMLRGQIQENQYQLNQVVERQRNIYQQLDSLGGGASTSTEATQPDNTASSTSPAATNSGKGDEKTDYNAAIDIVLNSKDYDKAIVELNNFINNYPKSSYQSNAQFWLGQMYYLKGNKDQAASTFAIVVKNYPKSQKASEAFYKIGLIMQEKGQKDNAKAVYQQVIKQYPNSAGAKLAQKQLGTL
ncbi:cell division protein CpoB [Proteus terrae subsp. cibarius]|uniref:Cell division coordinator CpoB n=1 Tax=Proteus terrae subsp. cibarius TaxID=626774 RepID=A0ABX6JNV7_9GAMM|nr:MULTISPECIES: cell division protein CpoB [Proteus]QHP75737.1 cell division protein CpoB [Proteus vulgaris]MBG3089633.1 cell division protein CpoB [Proteus terrae subsp. cibarius]MCM2365488.1 cell division protein CpoB [Proteus sp. FZP2095]QGW02395.1 cell division protein CpoB [Proteus terrae subsp. cibarius]QIF90592.1 cell division protein CpoB [Proteus terrae subsp. cibarius]